MGHVLALLDGTLMSSDRQCLSLCVSAGPTRLLARPRRANESDGRYFTPTLYEMVLARQATQSILGAGDLRSSCWFGRTTSLD